MARGVNILNILLNMKLPDKNSIATVGSVAVQLALVNVLNLLDIKPISAFGYYFGEMTSAYCNGTLTLDETINCAFILNKFATNKQRNPSSFQVRIRDRDMKLNHVLDSKV